MADPRPGKWYSRDTLLLLRSFGLSQFQAYSVVGYFMNYRRTVVLDIGTKKALVALKQSNDDTIRWGEAVFVQGALIDDVNRSMSHLCAMVPDNIKVIHAQFFRLDSPDKPVMMVCLSPVDELGASSTEAVAMQIVEREHDCTSLFALDDHLKDIGEVCLKAATVKRVPMVWQAGSTGHADAELGELVDDVKRLSWERMSNNSNRLLTYNDAKRVQKFFKWS